jgi:hypothetical protein
MATTRRSTAKKARGPVKGRAIVACGLLVFFAVTMAIVSRRALGVKTQEDIRTLRAEQRSLVAQQKYLEHAMRRATSRRAVVQEAQQRLGMGRPSEVQTRFLVSPQ